MSATEIIKNIKLSNFVLKHYGYKPEKGNTYSCCFHDERTGSFNISEEYNTFHCFGCGAKGNIYNFVAMKNNINLDDKDGFAKVVSIICNMEGIENNSYNCSKMKDGEIKILSDKTSQTINFRENLFKNKIGNAYNYLINRGFKPETIAAFHLGETPDKENYYRSKYTGYDVSNRISIPIIHMNYFDSVVGISFRDVTGREDTPKYIHDRTDVVFKKEELLYGYSVAKQYIDKSKEVYLVEGYFDVMSLHQIGVRNCLATMSNSMTDKQIDFISKIANKVVIIMDADQAGYNGFRASLPRLLSKDLDVRVVPTLGRLGKDVNEVCNKLQWSVQRIISTIKLNTKDAISFFMENDIALYDDIVLQKKLEIVNAYSDLLSKVKDNDKRRVYEKFLESKINF